MNVHVACPVRMDVRYRRITILVLVVHGSYSTGSRRGVGNIAT